MKCSECKKLVSTKFDLCEDCYKALWFDNAPVKGKESIEEPDFVIENEVAEITAVTPTLYYTDANTTIAFRLPKAYKVDTSKLSSEELELLVRALFSDVTFYDNHPHFETVKHLLTENE